MATTPVAQLDTLELPLETTGFVLRTLRDAQEKLRKEDYSTTANDMERCIHLLECGSDAEKVRELILILEENAPVMPGDIAALKRLFGDYLRTKGLARKGDVAA